MTSGSALTRCSTGGNLPALTRSARAGASLKLFGIWAASVTTLGPSSSPISCEPSAASGFAAAAGAAGFAASAGFAAAAGAAVAAGAAGAVVAAGAAGFGASVGLAAGA